MPHVTKKADASGNIPKWTMRNEMPLLFLDIPLVFVFASGPFNPAGHAQYATVDQIMADEKMSTLFGQMVEKCLCGESFWFLNEVSDKSPQGCVRTSC